MRGGKAKVAASKFTNQLPIDSARAARHVNADNFKVLSKKVICAQSVSDSLVLAWPPTHPLTASLSTLPTVICSNNQKGDDDAFELFPSSRKAEPAAAPAMVRPLASALAASSASASSAAIPITASALGYAPEAKAVAAAVPAVPAASVAAAALKMSTPKLAKSMISAPLEMLAFLPNDTGLPEAGAWQQVYRNGIIPS